MKPAGGTVICTCGREIWIWSCPICGMLFEAKALGKANLYGELALHLGTEHPGNYLEIAAPPKEQK